MPEADLDRRTQERLAGAADAVRGHPQTACVLALAAGLAAAGAGLAGSTAPDPGGGAGADVPAGGSAVVGGRVVALALVLGPALVLAALSRLRLPGLGVACASLMLVGALVGGERLAAIDAPARAIGGGLAVDTRAVLLAAPRPSSFGSSAEVELLGGEAAGARLLARTAEGLRWPDGVSPGAELRVTGYAVPPDDRSGDEFDWPAHLRRSGIAGELELESVAAGNGRRAGLPGLVDQLRTRAEAALAAGVEPDQAALIRGMVLGLDEDIDPLVRDDFRASGLAHLLAVSGQNVMLLGLLALPALAALRLGPRGRLAALFALIAVYVPLAGAGPSLQRAGVMGLAGLVAVAAGRPASRWYALLLAAAATLALNPRFVSDPGWQLSFAAVVGILVLAPGVRRPLSDLPAPVRDGAAITVAATAATAPLLAHHFDQVSLASLPANLLALPAVAPAMWIGMLQIAIGQAAALGGAPAAAAAVLAEALGAVNAVFLGYLQAVARQFAELPWAEVELRLDSPIAVAGAYIGLAAGSLGCARLARRAGPSATALLGVWRTKPRATRIAATAAVCAVVPLIAVDATAPDGPPDRLTVSFFDVGQGDATLIQHPDGGSVLIDGGPVEARVYQLVRSAGVERLDLVVATHAAADHHGGLIEVVERIPVGLLLEGGDRTRDESFRALLGEAERRGVRVLPARAGQALRVGGLTVDVLWPAPRPPGPPPEDPNLRAVTTVVSAGDFELLASGDAESPALAALELPDVEVLKVPHHGSDDPGLAVLLERVRPEVAAIGVGEDNTYGHPDPDTLAALEGAGAATYRTDQDGTVTVAVDGGEVVVSTER